MTTDIKNMTTFSIGSTITFYLTVKINLSPVDSQGAFILHKDDMLLDRENNVTFDSNSSAYHLIDAQPADSGEYYAEHLSQHAMLFTNRLFINVTNATNLNPSVTSQQHTSTYIN